jgi:uncharacterized protein (DUF2236 family)
MPEPYGTVRPWYASDSLRTIATKASENTNGAKSARTAPPVMPPREQADELIPPRGGVTWRISGDTRLFGASGYALLLQVAHPSVGAGVSEHSNFKEDPWGRLLRTLDYTTSMVYGGPDLAFEVGRRVREMHKQIKGVRPDGERYHALEPGPYAWVHATLAEAIIRAHRLFCSPQLTAAEVDEFWAEWLKMGRLIGVRDGDLPTDWGDLLTYFDAMVHEQLQHTEAAQDVLDSLLSPTAPPLPWMREGLWKVASWPSSRAGALATIGMLPPELRGRLGLEWNRSKQRRFNLLSAMSRRARPVMPRQALDFGPNYLRWRREAIARGDVASGGKRGRDPVAA